MSIVAINLWAQLPGTRFLHAVTGRALQAIDEALFDAADPKLRDGSLVRTVNFASLARDLSAATVGDLHLANQTYG